MFLLMVELVWRCDRCAAGVVSASVLIAGTYLSTPHGFVYEMTAVGMWALLTAR